MNLFQPKRYQLNTLEALRDFCRRCEQFGKPGLAFYDQTNRAYLPAPDLDQKIPYICLRLPTGGGKTYLAARSIGIVASELLFREHSLVLWLVPSTPILTQTLAALKDIKHPYHQALRADLGAVTVCTVEEALYLQPNTLYSTTTIIVSTIQAFRVLDQDIRNVYKQSGVLPGHFDHLPNDALERLQTYPDSSRPIPSLANVLALHQPLLIIDEAHNASTPLTYGTFARFAPSCVIEFTATPDTTSSTPSNVLYSVSASELKAEHMIKMPVRLETHENWKELLGKAVDQLDALQQLANDERVRTGEYIRPIMLLQAQPNYKDRDSVNVEEVRKTLLEEFPQIEPAHIAESTGSKDDLEGINILDPDCPVRFIITIQKLREGWDCSFAYVLCSVAEMKSSTAVEQILGRIIRLPQANRKQTGELNLAYAYVASSNFYETAHSLADGLISNGFTRQEASDLIVRPPQQSLDFGPLFVQPEDEIAAVILPEDESFTPSLLPAILQQKTVYEEESRTLSFQGVMSDPERKLLLAAMQTPDAQTAVEQLYQRSRGSSLLSVPPTPSEQGKPLRVPLLAIQTEFDLEVFSETHLLDNDWSLPFNNAVLSEADFPQHSPQGASGFIDVGEQSAKPIIAFREDQYSDPTTLLARTWQQKDLVIWLDRAIRRQVDLKQLTSHDTHLFLNDQVQKLILQRGFSLVALVHRRYGLRSVVLKRLTNLLVEARKQAFQHCLFGDLAESVVVSEDFAFSFDPDPHSYPAPMGSLRSEEQNFKRHYYPLVGPMNREETACAFFLDQRLGSKVDYWVRNVERQPHLSFWLQTSTDRFYPDFVCKLSDNRIFVVEYKGKDRWNNPEEIEKRELGALWEARSGGKCLFEMVTEKNFDPIRAKLS